MGTSPRQVRRAGSPQKGGQTLFHDRPQRVAVVVEDVNASQLHARAYRAEPYHRRDLEHRTILLPCRCSSCHEVRTLVMFNGGTSTVSARRPEVSSSAVNSSSKDATSAPGASTPASCNSLTSARRYTFVPPIKSEAPARSQTGDQPTAKKLPSSTTLPADLRTNSSRTGISSAG